jgi:hypothetical protein
MTCEMDVRLADTANGIKNISILKKVDFVDNVNVPPLFNYLSVNLLGHLFLSH